jgi:DHA3 family tetracycline resistance protein-like MFS transporter
VTGTFRAGSSLVFASPLLMTVFGIALFYGMSSEGFDRLWEAHFIRDLGFPGSPSTIDLFSLHIDVKPVVWFGAIRMGATVVSLGVSELAHRRLDLNSHRTVSRWLFAINVTQMISIVALAVAAGFWGGVFAFWVIVTLSRVYDPLYLGWINQNIRSDVRATVLSMSSQADSLGQIAGGPVIGVAGSLVSLRAALGATAAALIPALLLYMRAFSLGPQTVPGPGTSGAGDDAERV